MRLKKGQLRPPRIMVIRSDNQHEQGKRLVHSVSKTYDLVPVIAG